MSGWSGESCLLLQQELQMTSLDIGGLSLSLSLSLSLPLSLHLVKAYHPVRSIAPTHLPTTVCMSRS